MSELKLGQRAPEEAIRDAVHVAVASFKAGQSLAPGARVRLEGYRAFLAEGEATAVGITDPFGPRVELGEWVTVLMHPAVSSSVRHAWEMKPAEEIQRAIEDMEHTEWCRQACGWEY